MSPEPTLAGRADTSDDFEIGLTCYGLSTRQWIVQAANPVRYSVSLQEEVLNPANLSLIKAGAAPHETRPRRVIVTDDIVYDIYGQALRDYMAEQGAEYSVCVIPSGEQNKSIESALKVTTTLDEFGIDRRREPIIALGGGVVLDIVGMASSLYRRSTPYVRVPTTLVGLVDAGVGIKTGVNFGPGKNKLGTYFAPSCALLDASFLRTLNTRDISNGLAEILKIGLIKDSDLFALLESSSEQLVSGEAFVDTMDDTESIGMKVLRRAVHGMLEELQPNLWEQRLERLMDYGHSFSPDIEMAALPHLLHGEAVTVDMALTTAISQARGLVSDVGMRRVQEVMRRLRLPLWHEVCTPGLLNRALHNTTRHRDGLQRIPLPIEIGNGVFVNDLMERELLTANESLQNMAS